MHSTNKNITEFPLNLTPELCKVMPLEILSIITMSDRYLQTISYALL